MMQYFSTYILLISLIIVINARSSPQVKPSVNNQRLCPEEYRKLHGRADDTVSPLDDNNDDDDDDDVDESLENICEQAMAMVVRHKNFRKLNPTVLLGYCPHYNERLALAQQNTTLGENTQQETEGLEKNRYDDDRRHALRRQELKKRIALRFFHKRMSKH